MTKETIPAEQTARYMQALAKENVDRALRHQGRCVIMFGCSAHLKSVTQAYAAVTFFQEMCKAHEEKEELLLSLRVKDDDYLSALKKSLDGNYTNYALGHCVTQRDNRKQSVFNHGCTIASLIGFQNNIQIAATHVDLKEVSRRNYLFQNAFKLSALATKKHARLHATHIAPLTAKDAPIDASSREGRLLTDYYAFQAIVAAKSKDMMTEDRRTVIHMGSFDSLQDRDDARRPMLLDMIGNTLWSKMEETIVLAVPFVHTDEDQKAVEALKEKSLESKLLVHPVRLEDRFLEGKTDIGSAEQFNKAFAKQWNALCDANRTDDLKLHY